jgi:hypothetical protein
MAVRTASCAKTEFAPRSLTPVVSSSRNLPKDAMSAFIIPA